MGQGITVSMVKLATVILTTMVTVMAEESMPLKMGGHLCEVVDSINHRNEEADSYIGLVMAYPLDELALLNCACFKPSSQTSYVEFAGRTFHIGKIKGVDVIYVVTGEKSVNAAITVQMLVDKFNIKGIVHYGTSGSANYALSLGSVGIPTHVAFTSSWDWKEIKSEKGQNQELIFGDFNYRNPGQNLLGKVEFRPHQLFSNSKPKEDVFWLPIETKWLTLATQLKNLELQHCITVNKTYCLEEFPKLAYDVRGSTADVYLHNMSYREFLYKKFNVSNVDQESAAVVATSLSNEVPCIVFRGVSDMAGGAEPITSTRSVLDLAAANALHVAVEFIALLSDQTTTLHDP